MWLLIGIIAIVCWWVYSRTQKPQNFPPGPPRLPIVGSFPYMTGKGPKPSLLRGIDDQVKKYGRIFGFYFGNTPAVLLADHDLIKDALKLEQLAARPDFHPAERVRKGFEVMDKDGAGRVPGVLFSHGTYWKELRRFMLRNLRDFGFGKTSMEDLFHDEVAKLCQLLSKRTDRPISLQGTMNISIVNSLWLILVGENLDLEDPNLAKIVDLVNSLLAGSSPMSVLAAILPSPLMATWPILRNIGGFEQAKQTFEAVTDLVEPYVEEHERTLDPENIRDFLDLMLIEQRNSKDPKSCFHGYTGKITVINSVIDLFIAGMETTSTSLMIVFLHLLHHPEVQDKVHREIDQVVGGSRFPSLTDKEEMHYTNAVLLESMRVGSLAYLGVPHRALSEVTIGGYTLPKGTTVLTSLYHAMHDPEKFDNPEVFDPSRFLDNDGRFVHDDRVIPFSVGKRYCLGQSLAEKEFFIFFTGIMQQFKIQRAPGTNLPSYIDIFPAEALARAPEPYDVILTKRKL